MANSEVLIPIPGRLHSVATSGHVAGADEIYDDNLNKTQDVINQEVDQALDEIGQALGEGGSVDERIAAAENQVKTDIIGGATSEGDSLKKVEDRVSPLESAVGSGGTVDERIAEEGARHYLKDETYTKAEVNGMITTPNQVYVSVEADNTWTAGNLNTLIDTAAGSDKQKSDTIYRVGSWDGSQFDDTVYSEYAWNGTVYVHLSSKTQTGEVFDISAYHATGGTLQTYTDLSDALTGTNGGVPQTLQKGGMSVKFVQSSDNKYVQARCMAQNFTTDVTQWQGVDAEPVVESHNLVESGGVFNQIHIVEELLGRESEEKQMSVAVDGKYINSIGTPANYAPFGISNAISVHKGDLLVIKARSSSSAGLISKVITENSRWTVLQMGIDSGLNVVTTYYLVEEDCSIQFSYYTENGISVTVYSSDAINTLETQVIPSIQSKQEYYEKNTFGFIPELFQGIVNTSGEYNPTYQSRCTTKVFKNPDTNGIIITAKAGYEVVLAHGDSENSLTDLGYVISGTNGGTYKYTGGKPYLYLNIMKNPSVDFSPSDVDNGSILIESITSINQRLESLNEEKFNNSPQVFEMSIYGNNGGIRKLYTSPFVLYKGRKYKIEFESNNFATDVANGGAYLIIRNEEATNVPLTLTSSSPGSKPIPSTINNYTPTKSGTLFVFAELSEGAYLNIKVTQVDQDVLQLIKDNSKLFEAIQTLKEINVENMLLGGTVVGEVETTTIYPCGHVFVTNDNGVTGDCYIATFQSKTKINENDGKPNDYSGVLVGFNLANPERTANTYVALAPDDVVFEGQEYLAGYCEDCVAAQIDSNTIRCFISTANEAYSVYRDFDLLTKTFEQYCHQAYIVINGTQYRLMGNNAQTILQALGLQSSGGSNSCYRRSCPIKVGEYFYQIIGFDDVTTLCRSKNFGDDWQFVAQIPTNGDNVDEVAIYYANNRIYTMWTGNKTRRPNGDYDKVCYLDVTWGQDGDNLDIITGGIWSEPITLDMTGHDAPTIVVSDGKVYLIAQKLKYTSVQEDKVERANVYLNNYVVSRSIKSIYVFDLELNLIKEVTLRLRRGINTPRLATYEGNIYFYCGTNPKSIPGADTRQNLIFSYVDERIIDI